MNPADDPHRDAKLKSLTDALETILNDQPGVLCTAALSYMLAKSLACAPVEVRAEATEHTINMVRKLLAELAKQDV
jgi:hypothetical protein